MFLDWQIAKMGPIFMDLCYSFYCNSSEEILENYQKFYYESFRKYLEDLGGDIKQFYTLEGFKKKWMSYRNIGLLLAVIIMKVMVPEKEEAVNAAENAEKGREFLDIFKYESVNQDKYLMRVKGLIRHLINS